MAMHLFSIAKSVQVCGSFLAFFIPGFLAWLLSWFPYSYLSVFMVSNLDSFTDFSIPLLSYSLIP